MSILNLFSSAYNFYLANKKSLSNKNIILLKNTEEDCINSYNELSFFSEKQVYYFPSFDIDYYERSFSDPKTQLARSKTLTDLLSKMTPNGRIIVTNAKNLIKKLPPKYIFSDVLSISVGQTINIDSFFKTLIENGFIRSSNATDPGEFAVRGQILDIVLELNSGYRIIFDNNTVEEIKLYHTDTQLSYNSIKQISLYPINEIIFNTSTINNFKKYYLQNFGVNHQNDQLLLAILDHRKFPGYENFLPLFYPDSTSLIDYISNPIIVYDQSVKSYINEYFENTEQAYQSRILINKSNKEYYYPALPPSELLMSYTDLNNILNGPQNIFLNELDIHDDHIDESKISLVKLNQGAIINDELFIKLIKENIYIKKIIICCKLLSQIERLKSLLEHNNVFSQVISSNRESKLNIASLVLLKIEESFFSQDYLILNYHDFFKDSSHLTSKSKSKTRIKNILIELEGIESGEYVIHKEHGIGQFLALENIKVQGIDHDFIKILYAENAKLYIPVENIDNIKKYGYPEANLDKLGGVAWQKRKAKLKTRINEIASKILQIAAKRKSQQTLPVTIDYIEYDKFCKKFHFVETEDQLKVVEEIKQDLLSGKIMDRLICGDVGFGKTEIALRGAFFVANDKSDDLPQVAIVVPTTILSKQHYTRCLERFAGSGLKVAELSRLVSPANAKIVKEELASGKISIIIGTHALLSKDVKFYNLKLLIIDEEQHFGVLQKEKLKELKSSIHVLSLSATPIPRTLQMSMVGIKDLSLIATPPLGRLPIKTLILPFDIETVREALFKEYEQGGKSFYVVPRISDIPTIEKRLKIMVPNLKFAVIHGELSATEIDKVMEQFNNGLIDVLVSTAIIESGIDISIANTMIIHRTDQFGLAQIYQLRGRIGRGKKKANAYLTIEQNTLKDKARKRLELLQKSDHLGGGFAIASHDMDLRGYGNLVGSEQAGHIKEVGIELYQEMLDEELLNLQPENNLKQNNGLSPAINLGIPVFISENYISDNVLRLGIYRRIGNLTNNQELESFVNEMLDRFGSLPMEFKNLLGIVEIKFLCITLGIESLDVTDKGAVLKFAVSKDSEEIIIKLVNQYKQQIKIKPDHKIIYSQNFNKKKIIDETLELLRKFLP